MAKKKVTKKKTIKSVAVVEDSLLVESNLSGALKEVGSFDTSVLGNVELDVADEMDLFKNDIVIPKIHLIQSMSELRKAKKAEEGDYVDSKSEQILLAADSDLAFLPVIVMKTFKRWQEFKKIGDKREFIKSMIMTKENAMIPYEETIEGEDIARRQVISCYVLLGDDAQKGIIKPYIIDFAGAAGKGAGRDLVSDIKVLNTPAKDPKTGKVVRNGMPSWVGWFKLQQFEMTMNDNDFNAKKVEFGGMLPLEMWGFLKEANEQVKALMQDDSIEIDDRDLHEAAKTKVSSNVASKSDTASADI